MTLRREQWMRRASAAVNLQMLDDLAVRVSGIVFLTNLVLAPTSLQGQLRLPTPEGNHNLACWAISPAAGMPAGATVRGDCVTGSAFLPTALRRQDFVAPSAIDNEKRCPEPYGRELEILDDRERKDLSELQCNAEKTNRASGMIRSAREAPQAGIGPHPIRGALQHVIIPYTASCPNCRPTIDTIAVLGRSTDQVLIQPGSYLARSKGGDYFAVGIGRDQVIVFGPDGKLKHHFGRRGDGPGEFAGGAFRVEIGPRDSVVVIDGRRRVHVFSPTFQYARQFTLPANYRSLRMVPSGDILMAGIVRTSNNIGLWLHHIPRSGDLDGLKSFMPDTGDPPAIMHLAQDSASVWVQLSGTYSLVEWSLRGELLRTATVRGTPWLRGNSSDSVRRDTLIDGKVVSTRGTQQVSLSTAGVDRRGRIWVNAILPVTVRPRTLPRADQGPLDMTYLLEVLDLGQSQLVISYEMAAPVYFLSSEPTVYATRFDRDGLQQFVVMRITIP